ncbi:MAG: ATP-binding protein [Pseudomonas sp.]|nr:ATP-binding protein [Pseudomonas sp.]
MTVVTEVEFQALNGAHKKIELLHPERTNPLGFETTVITGQNGSSKSTLLKQLVHGLAAHLTQSDDGRLSLNPDRDQVLCVSGSVADRFPEKEHLNGSRTAFDVPNYTYVGQRVGSNLLSKKRPLEVMLGFALDESRQDRFAWSFFRDAHAHAGLRTSAKYVMHTRREFRGSRLDLIGTLQGKTAATDEMRRPEQVHPHVSHTTARWLLDEFSHDEFIELQDWMTNKDSKTLAVTLFEGGASVNASRLSLRALRLGLLTDLIRLRDVIVKPISNDAEFSVFELSSGEYHMFSTMLAIGFALERKATLLIDEPENNLHPQWQRDLMSSVFNICDQVKLKGHIIISTHSPLIVGSIPETSSVVDMSFDQPRLSLVSYGASSDELLLTQFGIGSSRNTVVVDTIQRAISLVEKGDFDNNEFLVLVPKLQKIRGALTDKDPMVSVIDALLGEEQGA